MKNIKQKKRNAAKAKKLLFIGSALINIFFTRQAIRRPKQSNNQMK